MKVRWTSNSVRLRITPQELALLQIGQAIEQSFLLAPGAGWGVEVKPAQATGLHMDASTLSITLSHADARDLALPDREGVYFKHGDIRYYIEKDFPCAHPRAGEAEETPTETFVPPAGFEERKNKA